MVGALATGTDGCNSGYFLRHSMIDHQERYCSAMSTVSAWPPVSDPGLAAEISAALSGESLAVLLYGSRARGAARSDSDVDVLQLVSENPRTYSQGRVNVAAYTPDHLTLLSQRGSLFVRHLRDEGLIISDPMGNLASILGQYRPPANYGPLKREMTLILSMPWVADAHQYEKSMLRAICYASRTALYINGDECNRLTFDVNKAATDSGFPSLAPLIRGAHLEQAKEISRYGFLLLKSSRPLDLPADLPSLAIWAQDEYPIAARLLEAVVAGDAEIGYTTLTLPVG
ncbi:Nucleotidyltransferase domain-containing protein [Streptomyces sp. 3213]|nr:Nucleotidyltransferase domain-containing protein [Streptomyces sp. 3213] [Streptomyces sp. 3213.3]